MLNGRENQIKDKQIENNGFYGSVNIADFQRQRSIPLQIPEQLIENVLVYAIASVEFELRTTVDSLRKKGINSVEEMNGPILNGKNFYKILFEKAVFARAKNELLPEFFTLASREIHEKRDLVIEQKQLQAEAIQAIRQLKGKGRATVDLL